MHTTAIIRAGAAVFAFAVDHACGEPPARIHPVVWIGEALAATGAPWADSPPRVAFVYGALCWIIGASASVGGAWLITLLIRRHVGSGSPTALLAAAVILGLLLKPLLAWRMLREEVAAVERSLALGLEQGRAQLRRLVSRDTRQLSETEIRESALESLAENLNDSLVAPLFWFVLGGLPAAALYRFANTADAVWGYRGQWEWAGKWAARADDVLSYVPARLTAVLLALAGGRSLTGIAAAAAVTPSPNSGWPMAMLARILGVRLSKPGVYVLNPEGGSADAIHMFDAAQICAHAAIFAIALSVAVLLALGSWL
ncbi:MAG TPA: adenosylcobinamide-phosphate synthase CbiB [Steroidobacteraceae bacterium]|nr:adenosylcobinamide-phosphate synthase CbiB [Steroidobacteraceae bacterium]